MEIGEAPGNGATEYDWQGDLGEVLAAVGMEIVGSVIQPELPTTITLYTNTKQ